MTGLDERAAVHRALADPHRLRMVDVLWFSDRTPGELQAETGLPSNLLAFHLDTLERAGVIDRHRSQGDGRRRYVRLRREIAGVAACAQASALPADRILFVCTHNAARSPLAAALWRRMGGSAESAGSDPAVEVNPLAIEVARHHGLDLRAGRPRPYAAVEVSPTLVVSVCDRAREAPIPFDAPMLHWSIPDPAGGRRSEVEDAFRELESRVAWLHTQVAA